MNLETTFSQKEPTEGTIQQHILHTLPSKVLLIQILVQWVPSSVLAFTPWHEMSSTVAKFIPSETTHHSFK